VGVGLVLGLSSPGVFGGDYSGGTVTATMAESGTGMMELTSKQAMERTRSISSAPPRARRPTPAAAAHDSSLALTRTSCGYAASSPR